MVRVSVLNDALKSMYNAEKIGKRQVMIRPSSKVIIKFLIVMQKHGYIGEFEYVDDHRSGKIVVELNGRLNKCGVISPRFDVGVKEIEPWTARLLPSRQFGYIVLTTSAGIMDHEEARRKNVGGKTWYACRLVLGLHLVRGAVEYNRGNSPFLTCDCHQSHNIDELTSLYCVFVDVDDVVDIDDVTNVDDVVL
ncbi:hypothetical protein TEA_022690 [Camellia sinensis var. sinensis]|uniref:40S ribosomal protein S15a n=1 Tax=Camellia sinensis var. sinensis TaxID=542762 RepID=A0A4S4ETJ5_CAMSN|nr:hypothetical protein TEA_022690 [Camellia sinensis var. sinensis]